MHALPDPSVARLGVLLGDAVYAGSSRYRRIALKNLRQVFGGEWSEEEIQATARETFRNFGKSAIEFLRQSAMTAEEVRRKSGYDGREHLEAARAGGKGALLATAHFGNWEIMGARMGVDGYRINVMARPADDAGLDRYINEIREQKGCRVLSRDTSVRPILQALRNNEFVGILGDQNFSRGIFVPFFGRLAATGTGIAAFARATGAPILPAYSIRQPDDTVRMLVKPPLAVDWTDDKDGDIARVTALITADVEAMVRQYPAQWLWIHDRWKYRPPEERAAPGGTNDGQEGQGGGRTAGYGESESLLEAREGR